MLLATIILLPILGSIVLLFIDRPSVIRQVGLQISLLTFVLSTFLWILFDKSTGEFQFVSKISYLGTINLYLGIDGISLFFILLTTLLIPICLLAGWESIKVHVKEYVILFLLLESLLNLVFSALDLVMFYIFFESVLIPMFIIIGIWGSRQRKIHAAYQFFLYTLLGSLLLLLAIIVIYFQTGTTDLQLLSFSNAFSKERENLLWLAFFASLAVKVPMVPVHIWLPEAHVEAPTAGSVILAGVLLKIGGYGFLRFAIPILPYSSVYFTPLVYTLSVIGVLYASLTTLRQIDLKKIIAYSSVAHMSFVTLGIFTLNIQGVEGSIMLMISHGLVSSALFYCVGILYDRHHTRLLEYYGGLVNVMPVYSVLFLLFTLGNLSLPLTSSFVGEFLVIIGLFQSNTTITFLAAIGVVLGAAYSIWLYNRVTFGPMKKFDAFVDVNAREFSVLLVLALLVIFVGIYPEPLLDTIHPSLSKIIL